jgi:UDP-N-acetylmuramoyl-tripeptide--D-alanyl-D-alanine ligase
VNAAAAATLLALPNLAAWAEGDLVVREVPASPPEREALLRSGITGVSLDTRTLAPGDLFVPLRGAHADGHDFVAQAFARGAAAALCERGPYERLRGHEPGPLVVVQDCTAALQRLGRRWRDGWTGELIAVTGSNGKTTTKDMVAAVLGTRYRTLRSEASLNNQWGVPLTLLRLRPEHEAAVLEMGMNHRGEIAGLAQVARPDAGLITNVGEAHLEHLGSIQAVAEAKAELGFALAAGSPLFVNADRPELLEALRGAPCRLFTFGLSASAELRPEAVEELGAEGVRLRVAGFPPVHLHLVGRHHAANALAALAVARALGLDPERCARALGTVRGSSLRMEVRPYHGGVLLLDCYNANPASMHAALETLAGWPGVTRRIAVLGDMLELGADAPRLHREAAAQARDAELWVVGRYAPDYAAGARQAGLATRVFPDKSELGAELARAVGPGVVALVKASRGSRLEDALAPLGPEG